MMMMVMVMVMMMMMMMTIVMITATLDDKEEKEEEDVGDHHTLSQVQAAAFEVLPLTPAHKFTTLLVGHHLMIKR